MTRSDQGILVALLGVDIHTYRTGDCHNRDSSAGVVVSGSDVNAANACARDATCAEGGATHCHQYELYPEALDDAGDGCCVVGCFLDVDGVNVK